jgi:hypothetical protein
LQPRYHPCAPKRQQRGHVRDLVRAGTGSFRVLSAEAELQAFTTCPVSVMPSKMANPLMKSARSVFVPVVYVSSRDLGLGCGGTPWTNPGLPRPTLNASLIYMIRDHRCLFEQSIKPQIWRISKGCKSEAEVSQNLSMDALLPR